MGNFDEAEDQYLSVDDQERRKRQEIMQKRSGADLVNKWAQEDRQAINAAEAKYAPPVVTEPRCHVCTSQHRVWIERKLLDGYSYSAIARMLPPDPDGKKFDHRQISNHSKKHMPLDDAVTRAVLEEEADVLGQQWEEGVKGAFTMRGALEVLIRKAYRDALNGVTTVEPRDLIQMIKTYNDMNVGAASTAIEEAKRDIRIFMVAIQNVCLKSELMEREEGQQVLMAVAQEVKNLRAEEAVEAEIEGHLQLPAGG